MNKYSFLFIPILLLIASFHAHAGFLVKRQTVAPATTGIIYQVPQNAAPLQRFNFYRSLLQGQADGTEKDAPKNYKSMKTAWKGIASIVCSVFGVAGFFVLGAAGITTGLTTILLLAGVVFGAMGMGRRNKNNGFAIAGFCLGILGLMISGLQAIIVAAYK